MYSTRRRCAASDIVRKDRVKVWGVLYELPDYLLNRDTARAYERRSFDEIEGEGRNYRRESIQVRRPNGDIVSALTYTVKAPQFGLRTNIEYVGHIVRGLREHAVPDEYIAKVKAIAAVNNPDIATEVGRL